MKKISGWANQHYRMAQGIIVLCHTLLYFAAMYTGNLLHEAGIILPLPVLFAAITVFLAGVFFYPSGGRYFLQKTCDLTIGLTVFICVCFLYNDNSRVNSFNAYPALHGSLGMIKETYKKDSVPSDMHTLSKKELRKQSAVLKKILRQGPNEKSDGTKTLLIILIVLGALLGLALVSVLACWLSCSGAGVAAVLVAVGGVVGVVWLAVICIKSVLRKRKPVAKPTDTVRLTE
jgi:hypothetical protein